MVIATITVNSIPTYFYFHGNKLGLVPFSSICLKGATLYPQVWTGSFSKDGPLES